MWPKCMSNKKASQYSAIPVQLSADQDKQLLNNLVVCRISRIASLFKLLVALVRDVVNRLLICYAFPYPHCSQRQFFKWASRCMLRNCSDMEYKQKTHNYQALITKQTISYLHHSHVLVFSDMSLFVHSYIKMIRFRLGLGKLRRQLLAENLYTVYNSPLNNLNYLYVHKN